MVIIILLVPGQQSCQVLESLCHCRSSNKKGQRTVILHFPTRLVMFVTVMQVCVVTLYVNTLLLSPTTV